MKKKLFLFFVMTFGMFIMPSIVNASEAYTEIVANWGIPKKANYIEYGRRTSSVNRYNLNFVTEPISTEKLSAYNFIFLNI